MFIQTGCISGWQSIDVPVTTCEMQGIALTLRNSTVSSIKHDTPKSRKDAQLASSGDAARSSDTYSANSITQLLLAASVNAYDNGPVLTSQYQVPIAFTNWANRGSVSSIGLRLGVATNETPSITVPNQVDFQQNFNGEDSLTMITGYYSASGNITVVGSGTKVLAEDVGQITIPLHGSTAEGDTVILVVMSELDLAIPSGFNWDYTDKIKGVLPNLNELQRNTQLSVFRKVVTLEDIFDGSFIVTTVNSQALLPSLVTPTNFTATVNYGTGIDLTWDDNSTFEDGYRVYRDTSPITGVLPSVYETLTPNSTSYTDTGVVDGVTYYYALGVYRDASEVLASPSVFVDYVPPVLPPDPLFNLVGMLLNLNGTQGSTSIIDSSSLARSYSANGDAQLTSEAGQYVFGGAALQLGGAGWVSTSANTALNSTEFTIEGWLKLDDNSQIFHALMTSGTPTFSPATTYIGVYGSGHPDPSLRKKLTIGNFLNGPVVLSSTLFETDVWYHFSVGRDNSNTVRLFVGGVLEATNTGQFGNFDFASNGASIGRSSWNETEYLTGKIDDLRYTAANRYTSNFSVPTYQYQDYGE